MSKELEKKLESVDVSRRDAIKKIVLGTAYVVPTVATFSLGAGKMDALAQFASNFS